MRARSHVFWAPVAVALLSLTACSRLVSVCVDEGCETGDAGGVIERPDGTQQADAGPRQHDSDDAGSSDAGSSDAGSSDAGSSDAGSSDAGSSDAGSSDPGCELRLTVHHEGPAGENVPIVVVLPFFGQLEPEASNLRFRDAGGTALSFWVEEVDATAVYAYVRLPELATGTTVVIASACPLPDEAGSDLVATFPWVALPGPDLDGFTPGCRNFDLPDTERCVVTLYNSAPESAELSAKGCCYGPTYNGSTTYLVANLAPLTGTYRLDMQRAASGEHYEFCGGNTETRWQLSVNDVVLSEEQCLLDNCNSCASALATRRSAPFALTGASQTLRVEVIAGDCSLQTLSFSALRLVPVLDPAPWVTFD